MSETTLKEALHTWLHRTPIRGSSPGDEGDDAVVSAFIEDYLAKVSDLHDRQAVAMPAALGVDPAKVAQRFKQSTAQARAFMVADDVDEGDRAFMRRVRAALVFIESYRTLPLLAWPRTLIDTIVETEEQFVLWRHRHARMVERVIGRRIGTGGSSGVEYLDKTTTMRVFNDLWTVRTLLLPRHELPELAEADFYDFVGQQS